MSHDAEIAPIQRILVALDGSPASIEALSAAARLAGLLRAELRGLFVEDTDLLSFAGLPFTAVTAAHGGPARRMEPDEVQRCLRLKAQRAREAMSWAASEAGISWSFRVVRGNVAREIFEAAGQADLLSLGYAGLSEPRRAGGGSMAYRAAQFAPRSVLIARKIGPPSAAIVALPPENGSPDRVLQAAAVSARTHQRQLVVVVREGAMSRQQFIDHAQAMLLPWQVDANWLVPQQRGPRAALTEALRVARGGLLVLHASSPLLQQEQIERLLDRGACSLLIIRDRPAARAGSRKRRATGPSPLHRRRG